MRKEENGSDKPLWSLYRPQFIDWLYGDWHGFQVISQRPVHLSMLPWGCFNQYSASHHRNDRQQRERNESCQNNERQQLERNESCQNDCHQSSKRILAKPRIEPATSCSHLVLYTTDWAMGLDTSERPQNWQKFFLWMTPNKPMIPIFKFLQLINWCNSSQSTSAWVPAFLTPVLAQIFFPSHLLFFSHTSEAKSQNMQHQECRVFQERLVSLNFEGFDQKNF